MGRDNSVITLIKNNTDHDYVRVDFFDNFYKYMETKPGKTVQISETYDYRDMSKEELIKQYQQEGFSDETEHAN